MKTETACFYDLVVCVDIFIYSDFDLVFTTDIIKGKDANLEQDLIENVNS